ncbi:tensin-3-like isoform X1 [Micropterus dolomieu]|uniref:tensin-3-like isoform X1 n=1 Tax=Micropterus dolomieu TaxID=147949 RepID=UPI001E8CA730|nr:tensin-3-like isoform X1 [Micropterus dolomieu]XP_045906359.1 tensin-3-like isoform X1 [Micropterus dolomieu]
MEEPQRIDLTYVTERIITIFCPPEYPDELYLQSLQEIILMLQSKHGHNYMLINLSQKNDSLTQMNHKVVDTGWVDLLAPNLDQIFSVCTMIENWLKTHPKHVLVLHCRGGKGRLGVLLASYIHFINMSSSAGLSLDHFAMRRFYSDKLSALMTPSQKRYVWMLGSILKGGLRMCPSPSFLLCVVLHGLPKIRPDGACCLFLRIYQSLQAVCTSAVYHVNAAQTDQLYFVLQPAQLLKGDIMVVCYDKDNRSVSRQVVFRLQFHTGLVHGHTLSFSKADLDCASEDPRFPEDGKVELFLSDSPEKITGRELWNNGRCVMVDYDTLEPLVRRDSFQGTSSLDTVPPHILDPGTDSLCARVRKRSSEEGSSFPLPTISPSCSDRAPSASSDSGLSVASQGQTGARQRRGAAQDTCSQAGKLVSGVDFEIAQPLLEAMTEFAASGGEGEMTGDESGLGNTTNGEASSSERETDILDDEDEVDGKAAPALDLPSSSSMCPLSSENLPVTQTEYSTHSWVRQQMVDVVTNTYCEVDREERLSWLRKKRPPPLVAPDTPSRGISSREAVQRGLADEESTHSVTQNTDVTHNIQSVSATHNLSCQEEELEALNTDIDESIEQLNQLILDLDPTFVPVPTRCTPLSRCASLHTNGLSHKGNAHQLGWRQQKQVSDVTDYAGLHSPGWRAAGAQSFRGSPVYSPSISPSQHEHLYKTNSVDYRGHTDSVPPTPAFPVSPPTPYVKHFSESSQLRAARQWDQHSWTQDSRNFLDSMNHAGGSSEGVSVTSASCQRIFGSMCSVSSDSPIPHTDSSTPPPVWHDRTPNSLNSPYSPYPPQPSPPLSLSTPNAHSSPRGALRGMSGGLGARSDTDSTDLSSLLLGNGGLEHSLLEAMDGLGSLNLVGDGGLPPMLPDKKRVGESGELGSRSPSLSGFSSPHSGSSLSIPFSSPMTPDPLRGLSGAQSPGADFSSKQDTVKFVQDTSKFWYKPDISRDQAIIMLKDKEPGSFIVRDSHSFRGAYGLAMKVATPPPSVLQQSKKGDLSSELVRHFLIECTQKGVRLKGCPNEPYFGSLTALVCQHSITPLALPCKLILPDKDPVEELNDSPAQTATNSAAELLKQGAACNVWYLGSVELESLTGQQAVQKATTLTLSKDPPPASTVVHFKVSAQGITLTDNQRKLFFRRHYAVNTVIFCSLDPQGRKWTRGSGSTAKIFGFVARKSQSETENLCHLFAEHDPEQPASAIVNFVSKVMIGSHKK